MEAKEIAVRRCIWQGPIDWSYFKEGFDPQESIHGTATQLFEKVRNYKNGSVAVCIVYSPEMGNLDMTLFASPLFQDHFRSIQIVDTPEHRTPRSARPDVRYAGVESMDEILNLERVSPDIVFLPALSMVEKDIAQHLKSEASILLIGEADTEIRDQIVSSIGTETPAFVGDMTKFDESIWKSI